VAKDDFEHNFESATGQIALDRQPRVHVEYTVYKGSAKLKKEIPFVMGVVAPLRGNRDADQSPAKRLESGFREITSQNFNDEMKRQRPTAKIEVDNALAKDGSKMQLELTFESMDDFSPAAVARKVDSLRKLLDLRTNMKELRAKIGAKPEAVAWLSKLLKDEPTLAPLREKIGAKPEGN
jgi:type VI secretion system protein ImpB